LIVQISFAQIKQFKKLLAMHLVIPGVIVFKKHYLS